MGTGIKCIEDNEQESLVVQRRAIRAKKNLYCGDTIKEEDLTPLRPCPIDAIQPYELSNNLGKVLLRSIPAGDYIRQSDLEPPN